MADVIIDHIPQGVCKIPHQQVAQFIAENILKDLEERIDKYFREKSYSGEHLKQFIRKEWL